LIARKLHDEPVQYMFGVAFSLASFQTSLSGKVDHRKLEELDDLQATLQATTAKLREISLELRPPELTQHGLASAIRSHAERFQEEHPEMELSLRLDKDGRRLPEEHRTELFHIYREAVRNAQKHAGAATTTVRLELTECRAMLEVSDDGQGFVVPERWGELVRDRHMGIIGMVERAEAVGGRLEIVSAPGKGTTLRAIVPVPTKREEETR
ncbi:MAG: histidine kinase, partial [Chloroflexota bacterium]|nr:histidine kinase [Chloroflexota bacterium]